MWAMTNRHKQISKLLLDHGANPEIKSSSGGTALDFVQPGSDFSHYLHDNGYHFGASNLEEDFYNSGFSQDRFEEEMAENELKRRMMMQESAANLEVDLSTLGFDEPPEVSLHYLISEFGLTLAVSDRAGSRRGGVYLGSMYRRPNVCFSNRQA